jgi:hypothetical protein
MRSRRQEARRLNASFVTKNSQSDGRRYDECSLLYRTATEIFESLGVQMRLFKHPVRTRFGISFIYLIACYYYLEVLACSGQAQEAQQLVPVQVEGRPYGEEIIGPYNQPRWSARGRFSADTDVYVLPPYSFYLDLDSPRHMWSVRM